METTEAPTREADVATVVAALDGISPVAHRRVAKQALGRLLASDSPDEIAGRKVVTLSPEYFEKLAQRGQDRREGDFRGTDSWGDREWAVYEIVNLIGDAEDRDA